MNKIIASTLALAVAGFASVATADRGRGGDYHRGSESRSYRGNDRGDRGGYDRGNHDRGRSRSGFSLSFGASSGGYGSSSFFGLGYSRGYGHGYGHSYSAPRYYRETYYAPAPVIIAPAPIVVERYYAPVYSSPGYYSRSYSGGGYYCR